MLVLTQAHVRNILLCKVYIFVVKNVKDIDKQTKQKYSTTINILISVYLPAYLPTYLSIKYGHSLDILL